MPAGISLAGEQVIRQWTNAARNGTTQATVAFIQLANGRVYSQSLVTGRIRTWRPKKHIVLSTNPRMSQIAKLERTYTKVVKKLSKMKALKRT